jgi:hypothetical protein
MSTLLDAGYLHIREQPVSLHERVSTPIVGEADTAYLVHLKPGMTMCPLDKAQCVEFRDEKSTAHYALVRLAPGAAASLSPQRVDSVRKLNFSPTKTEQRTLEYGLEKYGKQINNVTILMDDLGLPSPLSNHLNLLVPEAYKSLLAAHGFSKPLCVSERKSRNEGSSIAERKLHKLKTPDAVRRMYAEEGFFPARKVEASSLSRSCANGDLVLCSPAIVDDRPPGSAGAAIALTRTGSGGQPVASCGIICAGQIGICAAEGYDHVIGVYHAADDPHIRQKNGDGIFLHSWMQPESDLRYTHVLLSERGNTERAEIDTYDCKDLRDRRDVPMDQLITEMDKSMHGVTPLLTGKDVAISPRAEAASCGV